MVRARFSSLFLYVALLGSFPGIAAALITVGKLDLPSEVYDIKLLGTVAYVAAWSSGLQIIDVSHPTAPTRLGVIDTPGFTRGVALAGGLAYLADSYAGLRIIDISNPSAPAEIGVVASRGAASAIEVHDGFAYVASQSDGLEIFDVSDPMTPFKIGIFDTPGFVKDVAVVGSIAYLADGQFGLRIIDVSNPGIPKEIASVGRFGDASGIFVADGLAYMTDYTSYGSGLRIFDVSDPAAPIEIGSSPFDSVRRTRDVEVVGSLAYVASDTGLQVFDVSNPTSPIDLGVIDTPGDAEAVAVMDGFAYVADHWFGTMTPSSLRVIDISNPFRPRKVGEIKDISSSSVALSGNLAYVAASHGLRIVDYSEPESPIEVGFRYVASPTDVAVSGNVAYLTKSSGISGSVSIIDVSNPAAPILLSDVRTRGEAPGIAVADGFAYVADGSSGLSILDVSNPSSPILVGALDISYPFYAVEIAIADGMAYVAGGQGGMRVIDVSNPAAPVMVGSLTSYYQVISAVDVTVVGNLVYMADTRIGLVVVDVSDPSAPRVVGNLYNTYGSYGVFVDGTLAYLAFPGVRVIDVSDPNAPVELGAFSLDSTVYAVAAVDGLALYAASGSGPSIVDFGPEYLAKAKINIDIKPGSDSNPINLNLEGVVPVAILSSEDFNAEDVNGTTLSFGPDGASLAHWRGPHIGDVNGDGLTDLLGHFRIEDTGIAFGDTMACVSGETNDHKPFRGCDVVRTVPDMDGDLLLDVEEDAIGTHPLRFDSDGDGYGDGDEVLLMATDPLDPLDPAPAPLPGRRGIHNRRR